MEAVVAAARATVHTLRENGLLSRNGAGRQPSYTAVAASIDAHSLLHMKEKCVMDGTALLALLRAKTGKDTTTWLSEWATHDVCQGVVLRCGPPPRIDQLGLWLGRLEMLRLAIMSAGSCALAEWAGATDEYEDNKTQCATTMVRFRVSWQMSRTCQAHAVIWRTTWGAKFATAHSQSTWVAMKFRENIVRSIEAAERRCGLLEVNAEVDAEVGRAAVLVRNVCVGADVARFWRQVGAAAVVVSGGSRSALADSDLLQALETGTTGGGRRGRCSASASNSPSGWDALLRLLKQGEDGMCSRVHVWTVVRAALKQYDGWKM